LCDERGAFAERFVGCIVTYGGSDDLIGGAHCEWPITVVVRIAGHDVNQASAEKSEGGLASGPTECAKEATGGNLEHATLFDQTR
jgi:hypothetical protein